MSLWALLRRLFYAAAPSVLTGAWVRSRLIRRAQHLARRAQGVTEPDRLWRLLREFPEFLPLQREWEMLRFLELVACARPSRLCEIGTASGGTAFLLVRVAAPGAVLVTLDLGRQPGRSEALAVLAGPSRSIHSLVGDSHQLNTVERVRTLLDGPLDVVLIDGDHRYEGVAADFEAYLALVRPGGVIALHDIMPDSRGRRGSDTGTDAGDVPRFWSEVRARFPDQTSEIIEHSEQDAYGIGIVRVRP